MVKNIYIRVGERSFDTQTTKKRREIFPCFPPASLSSPAFRSFSNAKTDENKYLEIPNGRGYPRSDKSQVAPSTRKTHSKARRTTITPSLVLDEFLFIRSILGSLLLPLFFFFFFPPLHTLSSLFLASPLQVPIGTYPSSTRIQFQRRRRILCAKRSARTEREGKKNFAPVVVVVVGGE